MTETKKLYPALEADQIGSQENMDKRESKRMKDRLDLR
jgi:hypothetical protein